MIIDLSTITHSSRRFEFILDKDKWSSFERDNPHVSLDIPLDVKIEIYRAGKRYTLEGDMKGGCKIVCDRCLELYHHNIQSAFRVILTLFSSDNDKAEVELTEKDLEIGFLADNEINLYDIVREQVYVSLPLKSLCKEGCLGLCTQCGVNLNKISCQCKREQSNPDFLKLKNLKIEGE